MNKAIKAFIPSYIGCAYPKNRVYANNLIYNFLPQFQEVVKLISV